MSGFHSERPDTSAKARVAAALKAAVAQPELAPTSAPNKVKRDDPVSVERRRFAVEGTVKSLALKSGQAVDGGVLAELRETLPDFLAREGFGDLEPGLLAVVAMAERQLEARKAGHE